MSTEENQAYEYSQEEEENQAQSPENPDLEVKVQEKLREEEMVSVENQQVNQLEEGGAKKQQEEIQTVPATVNAVALEGYSPNTLGGMTNSSPVYSPKGPQEMFEKPRGSRLVLPKFFKSIGINLYPETKEEVEDVINWILYARIGQVVISLISFACIAGSGYFGALGNSGTSWALAVGVIVFVYSFAIGFAGFKSLASNDLIPSVSKVQLIVDLIFVFCTFSAFSTAATIGTLAVNSTITSAGALRAGAAFMFFLWLAFLHVVPMSFIVWREQELITNAPVLNNTELPTPSPVTQGVANV